MTDQVRLDFETEPREPERPTLRARVGDPDTSKESMERFNLDSMMSAMAVVVRLFRARGRMADFELKTAFAGAWTAPCCDHLYQQARSSARDQGLVRDTGERRINPTSNRRQVVWEACDVAPPKLEKCPTCGHVRRV